MDGIGVFLEGHGGKRAGAGRKPLAQEDRKPRKPTRKVEFTPEFYAVLQERARLHGMSIPAYIRWLVSNTET